MSTDHDPELVAHLEAVRVRLAEHATPQSQAAMRAKTDAAITQRVQAETLDRVHRGLRAKSQHARVIWIREAISVFAKAVAPIAACRRGCSACCHQAVVITRSEAEVIAEETGLSMDHRPAHLSQIHKMTSVEEAEADDRATRERVNGRPCPLLRDGRCAIYESRPMVCRLLFNVDRDALLCRIVPGESITVPYANGQNLRTASVMIADVSTPGGDHAELADWFPSASTFRR